uniref:Uncharacterized protein n=1 Tax=Oryza glaberrima TaxID=4538 RepID=I1P0X0_ORYGL
MSSPAEKSTSGGGGMSMNTVTTVMAFSVSAFFVLFIFVRLLCARIHLRAGQSAAAAAAAHGDAFPAFSVERGIRGLEPAVVTSFPTAKFGDGGSRPRAAAALEESQLRENEDDEEGALLVQWLNKKKNIEVVLKMSNGPT